MKSPRNKIQLLCPESFVKIDPLVDLEPGSVPPLGSLSMVTDASAVLQSGQPLAPDVKDATSVAASLAAWDGYPSRSPELSEEIPTLNPVKPDPLSLDLDSALEDVILPSSPVLPQNIDFTQPSHDPTVGCPPTRPGPPAAQLNLAVVPPLPPWGGEDGLPAFMTPCEESPQSKSVHHATNSLKTRLEHIPTCDAHGQIKWLRGERF